jgi:hypothetical protein
MPLGAVVNDGRVSSSTSRVTIAPNTHSRSKADTMAANATTQVTPGQAKWIVERLIAERRISSADVQTILAQVADEIVILERRLAALRGASPDAAVAPQKARTAARGPRQRQRPGGRPTKAVGHPRGIAGTLAVLLRSIPAAEHAAIAAIRADKGIKAAITAAKAAAKKA